VGAFKERPKLTLVKDGRSRLRQLRQQHAAIRHGVWNPQYPEAVCVREDRVEQAAHMANRLGCQWTSLRFSLCS
jgi:hypothetical protein